jgi:hypothetical protein
MWRVRSGPAEKLRPARPWRILAAMGKDITLSGFFLTADEWASMDPTSRAQMLAAVLRRDEPWPGVASGVIADMDDASDVEAYAAYELTWAA